MSENYTPSMEQLRTFWETHGTHVPAASAYLRIDRKAEFDRAIAAHDAELREQIAREILSRLPKLLADDSENEDGWLSDWDGQVWPAADDTRVDLTGDGSIDLDHIASHAVSIAGGKEQGQ